MNKLFLCICLFVINAFLLSATCNKQKTPNRLPGDVTRMEIEMSETGAPVKNIFSDINVWDLKDYWTNHAAGRPADFFRENFPFVRHIQLMTATGGNAARDLFIDPSDRSRMTDYNFNPLITACRNVVRQGLKPMIKTGAVPEKFCSRPHIGFFGVNVRPPDDYEVYYRYIKALAEALKQHFGLDELRSWSWGVLTEYENKDWFAAENDDPEATKIAYFKLYDYTVAALQDVIGASDLRVGAHSMTTVDGLWNELEFIDHAAKGTNYKTGQQGTQLNFLCSSFYESTPGKKSSRAMSATEVIEALRNRAVQNGLTHLQFGIDEGRILTGPEDDKRDLWSRVVGFSFQGASDARLFRQMNDAGADWFSSWSLLTGGLWEGIPLVSTHVANLAYKMTGERRLNRINVQHDPEQPAQELNAIASLNTSSNTAHILLYNYNADMLSSGVKNMVITLKNAGDIWGKKVRVKQWIVDDDHANFWPAWWADMKQRGLDKTAFSWSMYSTDLPRNLLHAADKDYWESKASHYKELSRLNATEYITDIKNNHLLLETPVKIHGVVMYEIVGIP